jgi:PmbA protein
MRERLLTSARDAIAMATEAGAPVATASTWWTRSLSIKHRERRIEKLQESISQGLSLAVILDGRYAVNSTTDLRPDALRAWVTEAVATARYTSEDPHRTLPDPARYEGQTTADLELFDPAVAALTADDLIPLAREAEAAGLDGGGDDVISITASSGARHAAVALVQSNGFEGTKQATSFSVSSSVTVKDENERRPAGGSYAATRYVSDMPPALDIGEDALTRALERRREAKDATRKAPVVVENRAARSLIRRLMWPLSGGALQQRRSMFEGKLGEALLASGFSLRDDPHRVRGLGSRRFDGEGIATEPRVVFEGGVLRTFFIDTYYGNKLGMDPTAGGSSNLIIEPGIRSAQDLITDADGGLYVQGFLGGNADSTTGDFSFGVRGRRIEGGELGAPVNEMNATGNLIDLFAGFVEAADDPYPYSSTLCPTLLFDGVQLSGA